VVDAMRFAVEVQTAMIERNAGVPEDTRIQFRVGIHLGDVVEESDGDLMGDGVNPRPGWSAFASVCLSEQAYWLAADTSGGASTNPASCAASRVVEPSPYNALCESHRAPPSGPAFALGRTPGTCKEGCCLDRHIRTVLGSQFFHDMANMHFYSAFAHVQFVGDDLVRLALMDRADNGEFASGDGAGGRGARRRAGRQDRGEEAFRRDVCPARQHKANRFDRDFKSHGHWDITFCPAANHGPHDLEIILGRKNDRR